MRDFEEEAGLLAALAPLVERASGVVTFNGAGFDLPLLETRFILARRRWPGGLGHLDLLRPSRRGGGAPLPPRPVPPPPPPGPRPPPAGRAPGPPRPPPPPPLPPPPPP